MWERIDGQIPLADFARYIFCRKYHNIEANSIYIMTNQTPFTDLRSILAQLYPQVDAARRISHDAGLELSRISFHGAALEIWHNILIEAQNTNRLDDLLNVIRVEYGENRELNNAYIKYLQWNRQGNVDDRVGNLCHLAQRTVMV